VTTEEGGGASRTTEAAAGSSAPTDVSLREFVAVQIAALDRYLGAEVHALRRETNLATNNAEKAIEVAAKEADERLKSHNGLIDQMREQAAAFASRESLENFKGERQRALETFKEDVDKRFGRVERFQAMLVGGMILISFIGIANLVKLWGG
jgi:hypothetical protein